MSGFISKLISILFPPHCFKCHKEGYSLCSLCLQHSKKSIDVRNPFIFSVYDFKDPLIKKTVHLIKYFHRKDLIEPLTSALIPEIVSIINQKKDNHWVLIPIPMPRLRKYLRGYNQAELIAQEISKHCHLPVVTDVLIRNATPKRQVTTKTRRERLQNQYHSFTIHSRLKHKHIILIDDVTTTGATLLEARKVLIQAGALSVKAVTLAH